jgi:hypothetical protein
MKFQSRAAVAALVLVVSVRPARAQIYEAVGTRAQGMAGAFVAVADDATATWWNPAGLATGAPVSVVVERQRLSQPATTPGGGPGWRESASGFAAAFPAMGLSYYRLRISQIRPSSPTAALQPGRQDQGSAGTDLRAFSAAQFGITVGQSLGRGLVVGSTLKLVRGGVATSGRAGGSSGGDLLDQADDLDTSSETHGDLDVGVMASASHVRLGVSMKHVTEPTFGKGSDGMMVLSRQARAGVAVVTSSAGMIDGLTLAFDADLTRTPTATGDAQRLAAGVEGWFLHRHVGIRGGVSRNRVAPAAPSSSAGFSLALRRRLYADGALTFGHDQARVGWAIALRATY